MQNTTPLNWKPVNYYEIPNTDLCLALYPYEVYWGSKMQILNYTGKGGINYIPNDKVEYWFLFSFKNHTDYSIKDIKVFKHCLN